MPFLTYSSNSLAPFMISRASSSPDSSVFSDGMPVLSTSRKTSIDFDLSLLFLRSFYSSVVCLVGPADA
jgi:hypothetical protein